MDHVGVLRTTLIADGLRCFAHGDLSGAATALHAALREQPDSLQTQQLVAAMRTLGCMLEAPPPVSEAAPVSEPWGAPSVWPAVDVHSSGAGVAQLAPRPPAAAAQAKADVPVQSLLSLQGRLHDLMVLHDFSGALGVAERILCVAPGYAPALRARHVCRKTLQQMYESRLPPRGIALRQLVRAEDVPWLDLDPRAGFVLSQVDGNSSLDEIMDICNLEPLEALRILAKLVADKVIGVVTPPTH